jgi:hypothetical protein
MKSKDVSFGESEHRGVPMNDVAIQVENLSKRYRIGLKEGMPDTMVGALTDWLRAPLENFRQLRCLTTFDDEGLRTKDEGQSPNGHSPVLSQRDAARSVVEGSASRIW